MTRIDPSAALEALRRSALPQERSNATPGSTTSKPDAVRTKQLATSQQQMLQRIRSIASDDPRRRDKAFRFFMEYVLLEKFGPNLQLDPEFANLVTQVLTQMNEDPQLRRACEAAADALLKSDQ